MPAASNLAFPGRGAQDRAQRRRNLTVRPDARPLDDGDPRGWRTSLGVTGVFVLLGGVLFWFGSGPWVGALHAGYYGDLAQMTGAAHDFWTGKLDQVYGSNLGLLALPLSFLAVLPLAPILGAMHQQVPNHDVATLLAGSYVLLLGSFFLHAVRKLVWHLGVRRNLVVLQIVAAVLVLLPEFEYGHLDDVLALTAVVYCVQRMLRREHLAAALTLSVAISFKQWAFVLVPLLVARAPEGRRLKATFAAAALPAVLTAACIALDGTSAMHAFFSPLPSSQMTGHPGFDPGWLGDHSSQASRLLAALLAAALGIGWRRVTEPAKLLAVVGVIFAIRPLTETVNYSYYWSPALMFVLLALLVSEQKVSLGAAGWSVAALAWSVPRGLDSSPQGWWVCQLILLGALSWKGLRVLRRAQSQTAPVGLPHAEPSLLSLDHNPSRSPHPASV